MKRVFGCGCGRRAIPACSEARLTTPTKTKANRQEHINGSINNATPQRNSNNSNSNNTNTNTTTNNTTNNTQYQYQRPKPTPTRPKTHLRVELAVQTLRPHVERVQKCRVERRRTRRASITTTNLPPRLGRGSQKILLRAAERLPLFPRRMERHGPANASRERSTGAIVVAPDKTREEAAKLCVHGPQG